MLLWPLGHATADEGTRGRSGPRILDLPPVLREELPEQVTTLLREHATHNFDPMGGSSIAHNIPDRATRTEFVVPGAEDDPIDPREHQRARAHGARLQSDHQGVPGQAPTVRMPPRRLAQRHHFGVAKRDSRERLARSSACRIHAAYPIEGSGRAGVLTR